MPQVPEPGRAAGWQAARSHLLVIALLYAPIIPVARLDHAELRGSGSAWIQLDMRGLYVAGYLIVAGLAATLVLVHLAMTRFRKPLSFGLVAACLFPPLVAIPVGGALFGAYSRADDQRRAAEIATAANALADAIQIRWSVRSGTAPTFELELTSRLAAELEHVSASGSAASRHGHFISSARPPTPLHLRPGTPQRLSLSIDHEPTPDTYWVIYGRFVVDGVRASVSWVDPTQESYGGDAERRIPLHSGASTATDD